MQPAKSSVPEKDDSAPRWQSLVLFCAALHSGLWGVFIIAMPDLSARIYGFARTPQDVHLWQGTGLFIVLLATGYTLASRDPRHHWSVVLIGLLAKILGALGMCGAVLQGQVPQDVLWLIPINDVVWWLPFAFIVRDGWQADRRRNQSCHS